MPEWIECILLAVSFIIVVGESHKGLKKAHATRPVVYSAIFAAAMLAFMVKWFKLGRSFDDFIGGGKLIIGSVIADSISPNITAFIAVVFQPIVLFMLIVSFIFQRKGAVAAASLPTSTASYDDQPELDVSQRILGLGVSVFILFEFYVRVLDMVPPQS